MHFDSPLPRGALLLVLLLAAVLSACGGGGSEPVAVPTDGTWELAMRENGVLVRRRFLPVQVPAASVPSPASLGGLTTAQAAQLYVGIVVWPTYGFASGNVVSVLAPLTGYTMVIDAATAANYSGCGSCDVGSAVEFDVAMLYRQSGIQVGEPLPEGPQEQTIRYVYLRVS